MWISPRLFFQQQSIKTPRLQLCIQTHGNAKSMEVHPSVFFIYIIHAPWNMKTSANMAANLVITLVTQRSGDMWTSHSQRKMHFSLDSMFRASLKGNPSITVQCSGGSTHLGPLPYSKPLSYVESVLVSPNPIPSSICGCLSMQNHLGSDVSCTWDCTKCTAPLLPMSL